MKELIKEIYLIGIKIQYMFIKIFYKEDKDQILFIQEFPYTVDNIENNLSNLLYKKVKINPQEISIGKQLKYIRKSKYIFCDNYYYPFSAINTKNKIITQVWHGAEAIKSIGFNSKEVEIQSEHTKKRYQKVYDSFSYYACATPHMKEIFVKSFNQPTSKMIESGYPKTDLYFKSQFQKKITQIKNKNDKNLSKLNILYLPTFRNTEKDYVKQIEIINELSEFYGEKYNIYYKFHREYLKKKQNKAQLKLLKKENEILDNDLEYYLEIADLIITDYSSLLFEAALLEKPVICYAYDYNDYQNQRGIEIQLEELPISICKDKNELFQSIDQKIGQKVAYEKYPQKYKLYNVNFSSRYLINKIIINNDENMQKNIDIKKYQVNIKEEK